MVMKQPSFEKALKKGELGEQLIRKRLEKKGWVVYFPFTKDRAHYFDMLATKKKEKVIALDVKTKARFNKWPAQGIDIKTYKQYKRFIKNHNVPFYLIFIDDKCGDIYAANIRKLSNGFHPREDIIAWYLEEMTFLFQLTKKQIALLSKYDQRNYLYNPIS